MISSSELRIGNKLFDWNWEVIDVEEIQYMDDNVPYKKELGEYAINQVKADLYNPIPLNEEWLLRAGFKKEKDADDEWHYFKYPISLYKFGGLNGDHEYYIMYEPDVQLKYVHQLQNLYFALTGLELEFKTP